MNPVIKDAGFRKQIFDREIKDYPVLFCEHTLIYYSVFSDGADKIVAGPVSIEKPSRELNNYVVQKHGISQKAGFQLAYCEMKVFGSAVLMFHHFLTGEVWRRGKSKGMDAYICCIRSPWNYNFYDYISIYKRTCAGNGNEKGFCTRFLGIQSAAEK